MESTPLFTSLGLFIIDENQYPRSSGRPPEFDIIGGGVSYAIVGARFAAGSKLAHRISGIIDQGTDFPLAVEQEIKSWGTSAVFRKNPDRLTTRGANIYDEKGLRSFVYRTPKKRIEAEDIINTGDLLQSRTFHTCCSIERCESIIDTFYEKRPKTSEGWPRVIFEPFPDECKAFNLKSLQNMLSKVYVFSPNLDEAAGFFSMTSPPKSEEGIKKLAAELLPSCSHDGGIVLRCGAMGCFIMTHNLSIMLPAYHRDQTKVVDVTGGGNSFCGAFIVALELTGDWITAGIIANLASGSVIERLGMPSIDGNVWNGVSFQNRLQRYLLDNQELLATYNKPKINWM